MSQHKLLKGWRKLWHGALLAAMLMLSAVPFAHADEQQPNATPYQIHLPLLANGVQLATTDDEADDEDNLPPGPPAAWDVDTAPDVPTGRATTQSTTDCVGAATRTIRYTSDGVIHLAGCGQIFTMTDVAAAPVVDTSKLELVDPAKKIWFLKVKLKVEEGATLNVIGGAEGDANWLRLRSDNTSGIWLKNENGTLLFKNTKVTTWDTSKNDVDHSYDVAPDGTGGRSYIATRSVWTSGRATVPPTTCDQNGGSRESYEARMDIVNSEFSYLGYNAAESYGMVWKVYSKTPPPERQLYDMVDVFGDVTGSIFNHNYFGSYTYGAYCMNWTNNTFENNAKYGLDPHDDSDLLTIANNVFRNNGTHGVICSMFCSNIVIRNNQSYGNLHGIMIHRQVNNAIIEGNVSRDNRKAGIAIFDSHDAVVRDNTVTNNAEAAIRLSVGASRNLVEHNTLTGLSADGVGSGYVVYTYKGSDAPTLGGDGMPKDNMLRNNQITSYKPSAIKIGDGVRNVLAGNTIHGPAPQFELLRQATGNIVRDAEIGITLQFKLDSTSEAVLQDSRGVVWQLPNGLATTAAPDGSTATLRFTDVGSLVAATPLDLAVRPSGGSMAVAPVAWSADQKRWNEQPSGATGVVAHAVGGLQAGIAYTVQANGQSLGTLTSDSSGHISFTYTGSGATTFDVTPAAPSSAPAAPNMQHWLPLAQS